MRCLVLAAVVGSLLAAVPADRALARGDGAIAWRAQASAMARGPIVGLNANVAGWGDASTMPRMDAVVSATGTTWLREEFDWATVEPTAGHFDFSYDDHFMQVAAARGEHILPVLYDTPSWAGATDATLPTDTTAFAQYVSAVVARYGPRGSFWAEHPTLDRGLAPTTWEVWNEPYGGSGDAGRYDPAAYARLVRAAAIAGRAQDPNAKFLLAAEMTGARQRDGDWQWWVDALYRAVPDLSSYYDGVAVHDYGDDFSAPLAVRPDRPYRNGDRVRRIGDIRRLLLAHRANKPFWITEAGWSTCADGPTCVSPARQAANLSALMRLVRGRWRRWVHAVFVYSYADGAVPTSTQGGYGLTTADGAPKPALSVFRAQARLGAG